MHFVEMIWPKSALSVVQLPKISLPCAFASDRLILIHKRPTICISKVDVYR